VNSCVPNVGCQIFAGDHTYIGLHFMVIESIMCVSQYLLYNVPLDCLSGVAPAFCAYSSSFCGRGSLFISRPSLHRPNSIIAYTKYVDVF